MIRLVVDQPWFWQTEAQTWFLFQSAFILKKRLFASRKWTDALSMILQRRSAAEPADWLCNMTPSYLRLRLLPSMWCVLVVRSGSPRQLVNVSVVRLLLSSRRHSLRQIHTTPVVQSWVPERTMSWGTWTHSRLLWRRRSLQCDITGTEQSDGGGYFSSSCLCWMTVASLADLKPETHQTVFNCPVNQCSCLHTDVGCCCCCFCYYSYYFCLYLNLRSLKRLIMCSEFIWQIFSDKCDHHYKLTKRKES